MRSQNKKGVLLGAAVCLSSLLSACGGGGDSSSNVIVTPTSTPTLASCVSATIGNGFTRSVTSADFSTGMESTFNEADSISSDQYEGDAVTAMTYSWDGTPEKKLSYEKYSDQKYVILAQESGATKYAGFVIDLTKKLGETQTFSYVITENGTVGNPKTITLKFDGQETLTLAGKSLNTCRIVMSLDSTDMEFNDPDDRLGTSTHTWWIAPGYGFMPVKAVGNVTFSDGKLPAAAPYSSTLTSYSAALSASGRARAQEAKVSRKRHFLL